MVIFWGLLSGFTYGCGDVFTRLGVRSGTPFTGAVVTSASMAIFFLIAVFVRGVSPGPLWPAVGWFFLTGIAATGPGRMIYYFSFRRIGVSRASVLVIITPLVSMLIGVTFLGETPSWLLVVGAFFIVGGVMSVLTDRSTIRISLPAALLGLLPAFFFALTPVFIRLGMLALPDPILGGFITSVGALAFILAVQKPVPSADRWGLDRRAFWCFLFGGVFYMVSFFAFYQALGLETVSFVTPLVYTSPLFSLLIARLFIQKLEQVTWRLAVGAVVVFLGVILVSISQGG